MGKVAPVLLVLMLSSCVGYQSGGTNIGGGIAVKSLVTVGEETAKSLTESYERVVSSCPSFEKQSAITCSGVLLRGTHSSIAYHSWNPNPSPSTTGVSFSYVRKDIKFNQILGYSNGFIFYPQQEIPKDKINIDVLCFFPIDGVTSIRDSEGCGQMDGYPDSRECQVQGIATAKAWAKHFEVAPHKYVCGFNIRNSLGGGAVDAFNEGLKAQKLVQDFAFREWTEVRTVKWAQDIGKVLPIKAFFYFSTSGLWGAQHDQKDFRAQTSISLPIIYIKMPDSPSEDATFHFIPEDQAIPLG